MKRGLVLGKFMPVHKGHLALIDFAAERCNHLTVLLCYHSNESISGKQRLQWLQTILCERQEIRIISVDYDPKELTETSNADPAYAKAWSEKLLPLLPKIDVFFSSESYGNAFASFLGATHIKFDENRKLVPVSASLIRQKPLTYWHYLPEVVKPFFVKKIIILGTESTGKSTLCERLAIHYNTSFVPEMARDVVSHTNDCTEADLLHIATVHASEIIKQSNKANKFLFIDTDINITKSYSWFLFKKELVIPKWVAESNKGHLYLFLRADCPYVQDGTRLSENEREALNESHLLQLKKSSVTFKAVSGNWEERFLESCCIVDDFVSNF